MKEAEFPLCQGCLSVDRRCNDVNQNDFNVFIRILDPKAGCKFLNSLVLCWECEATLRKFKTFQLKIQRAQNVLKDLSLTNLKPQCLSTLKTSIKTKYDSDINISLQLKEITITKIGAYVKPTWDDEFKIKIELCSPKVKDEIDIKSNKSPENHDFSNDNHYFSNDNHYFSNDNHDFSNDNHDFSNDNYDIYESDPNSDNKSIKDIKIEKKGLKKRQEDRNTNNKKEKDNSVNLKPLNPLFGQPIRLKNPKEQYKVLSVIKSAPKRKKTDRVTKEDKSDPTFVPKCSKVKQNNLKSKGEYDKKYTKLQINKNNIMQYFTQYTLSVSEYKEFLDKLSKTTYFMNSNRVCVKCVVAFNEEKDFSDHMKLHDSTNGNFSCSLCDLYFLYEQQYNDHTQAHLTVHQCKICKQTCGLQHSLRGHIETIHKVGLVLKCQECGVMFGSRSAMCEHINLLHERFECHHCGKLLNSRKTMSKHMRVKHLPATCPHCSVNFTHYTSLLAHLANKHSHTGKRPNKYKMEDLYCVECDKQFTNRKRFQAHTQEVHVQKRSKLRVPCPVCGKQFTKQVYLNNHYKLFHGGGTKHRCDPCNKCFVTANGLERHKLRLHQKIPFPKTIVCEICGRCFQSMTILTNHIRTHTGERPYECSHCDARFSQKYPRDLHERKIHLQHS